MQAHGQHNSQPHAKYTMQFQSNENSVSPKILRYHPIQTHKYTADSDATYDIKKKNHDV